MARKYVKLSRDEAQNIILEVLKREDYGHHLDIFRQILEKNYNIYFSSEELARLINNLVLLKKVRISAYGDCEDPDSPLVALISIS